MYVNCTVYCFILRCAHELCRPVYVFVYTSRDSPPSASFHCYGAPLMTFPCRHFDDGTSTITILVDVMMLGQCMLLVIASDIVNRMPIPGSDGV